MPHASVRVEEDPAHRMECEMPRLTSRLRKAKMLETSGIQYIFHTKKTMQRCTVFSTYPLTIPLRTKATFAGRSAKRRMK